LATEWHALYPEVFDDDDLRQPRNQPTKHFFEWLAAIHLYHRDGAFALVEKYGYRNHDRKVQCLDVVLGTEGAEFVRGLKSVHHVQPPDLFLYVPGTSRYWFAEVKGPTDALSSKQNASHALLAERFGVEIEVIAVRVAPGGVEDSL